MKFRNLIPVVVLVVLVTIISVFAQNEPQLCPGGTLTVSMHAPEEKGMANVQTVALDENCNPVFGSIQTVPINELPSNQADTNLRYTEFESLIFDEVTVPLSAP